MAKKRLDVLVTERGLAESRQKAQALIMAGEVFSGDRKLDKAGMSVEDTIPLEVRGNTLRYVGRGGLKLEKAMEANCLGSLVIVGGHRAAYIPTRPFRKSDRSSWRPRRQNWSM